MKSKFALIGYKEQSVVLDAYLCSTGIEKETEFCFFGHLIGYFDTEMKAIDNMKEVAETKTFEAYEIKKVFTKN